MTLTWRPITVDDIPALAVLINLLAEFDGTGGAVTEEALADNLRMPRFNVETDTVSVWSGDRLVGTGSVFARDELVDGRVLVGLEGGIHPDHRRQGLGAEMQARLERRGLQIAADLFPGETIRLRSSGGLAGSSTQRLLESFGYTPDNYFLTMEADLATWTDPGGDSRAVAPDRDLLLATREAHNDAFRDHRNHSDFAADVWEHWLESASNRHEHSRVVVQDDRVLAYAIANEYTPGMLHVALLGTRREARGQGLARDVLTALLRSARGGYRVVELEVDSTSPTGADRLYRNVGFGPVRTISRYVRDVEPA